VVDTIKVGEGSSTLLTEGLKTTKEMLFFLAAGSEAEKPKKNDRKPPVIPRKNGSPSKKTVAGKVLRNSRRSAQDEVHTSALTKLVEHQRELHQKLQSEGLEKYSEEGDGTGNKEGDGWKKFQSYKGDGALPPEAEKLRV
jgi:nucleosome binding factor SPN SPT16 subunit